MRVKTLITGGGTGGHVYPALSIIRYLRGQLPGAVSPGPEASAPIGGTSPERSDTLLYIGNIQGLERTLVPRAGIHTYLFPMAPPTSPRGIALLTIATVRSLLALWRERPQVTFATGGYVSVPAGIASWLLRIPVVLFLPDVVPGKAVRLLVPLARCITVSNEDALRYLPDHKTVVTGYPVREVFLDTSREQGRKRFKLPANAPVLGVFGGSQGARSINEAVARHLPALLDRYYVLHVCGEQRLPEARAAAERLQPAQRSRYQLFPYLHDTDMADALAAVDAAVCRSGASVLGELPATGTPGILVPIPLATVHQDENARFLANHGAAVLVPDDQLPERLLREVQAILDSPTRREEMAAACRALAHPDAAVHIATLIQEAA